MDTRTQKHTHTHKCEIRPRPRINRETNVWSKSTDLAENEGGENTNAKMLFSDFHYTMQVCDCKPNGIRLPEKEFFPLERVSLPLSLSKDKHKTTTFPQ